MIMKEQSLSYCYFIYNRKIRSKTTNVQSTKVVCSVLVLQVSLDENIPKPVLMVSVVLQS
jgi:hypothetical protein